jgi:hypothetical protein
VRILVTTMVILALAVPAYAQLSTGGAPGGSGASGGSGGSSSARPGLTLGGEKKAKTDDELQEEKEREEAYKAGVNKIPDQKPKSDPWGSIRGAATTPTKAAPQTKSSQQRPAASK